MKPGGRLRFFVSLTSILAATFVVGTLVYQTTYDTLRRSYQQILENSVRQGAFLVDGFVENQFSLLSLYASGPSVQAGQASDLPEWLTSPWQGGLNPKRLTFIDAQGRGLASTGQVFDASDRPYFQLAKRGIRNLAGPVVSRIDGQPIIVAAVPVPGNHPRAAVVSASISPASFRLLLDSLQGLAGAEFTLAEPGGQVVATTAGTKPLAGGELLSARRVLDHESWVLTARVRLADLLGPVRSIFFLVGILVVVGGVLAVVFYLNGLGHRRALDQAREDRTQALRDAYEQIRKLAYHDTVTRLPNRNLVIRKLGEALQAGTDLVVLVVALGRFRALTTTFGLHFGDIVLKEAGARLAAFAPTEEGCFLGRLGGSEFIVFLPAERYCSQTLPQVLGLFEQPMGRADLRLHVNIHAGACRILESGKTPEEVIKSAETALWAARDRGPHEACELDAGAVAQRLRRAQLQKLLPEAIERNELEVHFQPQVALDSGEIMGYEALLRWTSPELGAVSPVDFIPVAEETGAIVKMGYWVLDRGIEFARTLWQEEKPAVVSVNVSPVQFLHHGFLEEVARRVEASGLPHHWLGLEITESALMEGIDQLRPALRRVMDLGIKVSLDDFGTGYSSLNYLRELPLHTLKIDKSFIQALEDDDKAYRLTESIIELAHHLGLVVVAEGIESARQQELLGTIGCDLLQGFRTGRPRPARDHLDWVLK